MQAFAASKEIIVKKLTRYIHRSLVLIVAFDNNAAFICEGGIVSRQKSRMEFFLLDLADYAITLTILTYWYQRSLPSVHIIIADVAQWNQSLNILLPYVISYR